MNQSIQCPECQSQASKVIDSRWTGSLTITADGSERTLPRKMSGFLNAVRRRRECPNGHRYSTYEIVESDIPKLERIKVCRQSMRLVQSILDELAKGVDYIDLRKEKHEGTSAAS